MNRCQLCGSHVVVEPPKPKSNYIKHFITGEVYESTDIEQLQSLVKSFGHRYTDYAHSNDGLTFTKWSLSSELARKGIIIPKGLQGSLKRIWLKQGMEIEE